DRDNHDAGRCIDVVPVDLLPVWHAQHLAHELLRLGKKHLGRNERRVLHLRYPVGGTAHAVHSSARSHMFSKSLVYRPNTLPSAASRSSNVGELLPTKNRR